MKILFKKQASYRKNHWEPLHHKICTFYPWGIQTYCLIFCSYSFLILFLRCIFEFASFDPNTPVLSRHMKLLFQPTMPNKTKCTKPSKKIILSRALYALMDEYCSWFQDLGGKKSSTVWYILQNPVESWNTLFLS